MQITVLYFASARERAGCPEETLALPEDATLGALQARVEARHPALAALLPYVRWAVDEAFVSAPSAPLRAGQVVALIPPVAGGGLELVEVRGEPLDAREVEALVAGPDRGAVVTFTGVVRDHTGPRSVVRLEYEAYQSMAVRALEAIRHEAAERWPEVRLAVQHRVGVLAIGEAAVVVAASAPHRARAFEACAWFLERLKQDVPIWKKEIYPEGPGAPSSEWVGRGS